MLVLLYIQCFSSYVFAVLLKKITAFAGEDPNKEEPSWISLPFPC